MSRKEELILAVRTAGLPEQIATVPGFYPGEGFQVGQPVNTLEDAGLFLGPRYLLEDMPEFMQIIPYIVVRSGGKYVSYTRTPKGGEARLEGKTSIGLGGHIDMADVAAVESQIELMHTVRRALWRELEEEVPGLVVSHINFAGLLTDPSNAVGKVHIGLVVTCDMFGDLPTTSEDALTNVTLRDPEELLALPGLENWTRILMETRLSV